MAALRPCEPQTRPQNRSPEFIGASCNAPGQHGRRKRKLPASVNVKLRGSRPNLEFWDLGVELGETANFTVAIGTELGWQKVLASKVRCAGLARRLGRKSPGGPQQLRCVSCSQRPRCINRAGVGVLELRIEPHSIPPRSIDPIPATMSTITRTLGNLRRVGLKVSPCHNPR